MSNSSSTNLGRYKPVLFLLSVVIGLATLGVMLPWVNDRSQRNTHRDTLLAFANLEAQEREFRVRFRNIAGVELQEALQDVSKVKFYEAISATRSAQDSWNDFAVQAASFSVIERIRESVRVVVGPSTSNPTEAVNAVALELLQHDMSQCMASIQRAEVRLTEVVNYWDTFRANRSSGMDLGGTK